MPLAPHSPCPMPAFPWPAQLDVGNERMNGEHRSLMEAANQLCLLARVRPATATLRHAARELIALVEVHFESEEMLFPSIGYPRRQAHVREHLLVMGGLRALLLREPAPDPVVATATARLLLLEHIVRHDMDLHAH